MRLGADGLLSGEGLHRVAVPPSGVMSYAAGPSVEPSMPTPRTEPASRLEASAPSRSGQGPDDARHDEETNAIGEPVLSADELRALLQEQPLPPPVGNSE
jgi:hypothetical protein